MPVTYRFSRNDFVSAMLLLDRLTPLRVLVTVSIATVFVLLAALGPSWFRVPSLGGMLVSGTALLLAARALLMLWNAGRQYRKHKALYEGEFTIELLDTGYRVVGAHGERTATWDQLLGWRQNDRVLLIYFEPGILRLVPKSVQAQGFDLAGLIEQLHKHAGPER